MEEKKRFTVETCFSPALFKHRLTGGNAVVVIIDILRATTSICAAFQNGVKEILPVAGLDEAKAFKEKGFLVASERDGIVLDFADFGNSAFNFMTDAVVGKSIVYCTTNGTQAIDLARNNSEVVIGAFVNITVLADWICSKKKDIVLLCAGWKNKFNLEDSLFAGALIERLMDSGLFVFDCDSSNAALDLWKLASKDVLDYLEKAAHRHRLKAKGLDDVLEYSFTNDSCNVIPIMKNNKIVDALK